jgi:hypothetical protein
MLSETEDFRSELLLLITTAIARILRQKPWTGLCPSPARLPSILLQELGF